MRIWRISNYPDLSGRGGLVAASRWNHVKTPIVYCADHPASALLEMLVHVDTEDLPASYQLLEITVPDHVGITEPHLPDHWRDDIGATRNIGTDFVARESEPVLKVPSILVPFASNYLLNPKLVETAGIAITGRTRHMIDERLLVR